MPQPLPLHSAVNLGGLLSPTWGATFAQSSGMVKGSAGVAPGLESRARDRGCCPVALLRCLEQRTRSSAADTCSHVRTVAMVCEHPTWPGQAARSEPGIQVTLCGRCHLALPHPSHRPTCLCHTGVSSDASPGPAGACTACAQLSLPCAPGSLCLPFCLLVMWQPLLWPLGKGKCC